MATEFDESTNAIRLELNKFEEANLLCSDHEGNRKIYRANDQHPFYNTIHDLVRNYLGMDTLIEHVAKKLGNVEEVYLTGDLCKGKGSSFIDLILVGLDIKRDYLALLVEKAEQLVDRKVRYVLYDPQEFELSSAKLEQQGLFLLWQQEA
ncbi:MAG: ArsR family transcriptional regulator [Bacteroidota bacterium]